MPPYYQQDRITLYNSMCEDRLPCLPAASVDLIFTSPPYNIAKGLRNREGGRESSKWHAPALRDGYGPHDDAMPYEEYVRWQRVVLRECWRVIKPTGAIFYVHKPRVQDKVLQTPLDLNPGLPVRQVIIWARDGGINYCRSHYMPTCEWIVVFAGPDFKLKNQGASGAGDVWSFGHDRDNPHPAPFPLALPLRAIETTGARSVLDPFAGSGTSLVAARLMGIEGIGIELSAPYCDLIVNRLRQDVLPLTLPPPAPPRDHGALVAGEEGVGG